ncbi:glycosyltransferase family 4 protein [Cupriavidus basilensis]|uniref:glycosyltransferase family 4 protein n=1 Tax=Cupriavidus basilensis TaxID=68895 RepID=UPI00075092B9|nr:glycosyltransferase family 1 protein [Cupriavidus basilensis]
MSPRLLLDITRLMRRSGHATPTGIDRVEMAYAHYLARHAGERLTYTALHPGGWHVRLPRAAAESFLRETALQWRGEPAHALRAAGRLWLRLCLSAPRRAMAADPAAYLLLSHTNLERPAAVARALANEHARLVCLVHDLIPLTHPEFARAGTSLAHRQRLQTVEALADLVVTNSGATLRSLIALLGPGQRPAHMLAVPLGVSLPAACSDARAARPPYFVMLGTIEPRKNHVLLLQVWQRMLSMAGATPTPQLVIVGRNGWENTHVMTILERAPGLNGVVSLASGRSDREVAALLRGARALLMPSFAEGFGLPVAEALALGVPVIASDLPALRETGGGTPDYLDPMDGPAWLRAIRDYTPPDSPRRAAQLGRLAAWTAPTWDAHCGGVLDAIDTLLQGGAPRAAQEPHLAA